MFLWFSYIRVSDQGTWNAVATGQRSSNLVDRWLPLSEGMPVLNSNQGANQFVSWLYNTGGVEAISLSFAILETCTFLLWSIILFRITSPGCALMGTVAIVAASFFQINGLNAISISHLFFATLFLLLAIETKDKRIQWVDAGLRSWFSIAVLMIVWANVGASVFAGILVLLLLAVCRVFETGGKCLNDAEFHKRVWLFQIGLLATAFTPAGVQSWYEVFATGSLLNSLGGWQPSMMAGFNGAVVGIFWLTWLFTNKDSTRSISFFDAAAILLTIGVACSQNLIAWFAPIICLAIAQKASPVESLITEPFSIQGRMKFAFTLLSGLIIWLGFCFSPFGNQILGGQQRSYAQFVGSDFPLELKSKLNELGSPKTVWSPVEWADWLAVDSTTQLFMNQDQSRFPGTVKTDYHSIYVGNNWKRLVDKYAIETMAIDKNRQSQFMPKFRQAPGAWRIAYENKKSALLRRVR